MMRTDDLQLLSLRQVSGLLGICRTTIWSRLKNDPDFPKPLRNLAGQKKLYWRRSTIAAYLDRLEAEANANAEQGHAA
ncbi:hypothetical protein AUC68_11245 [Methyloceanibacter methanicus]|uniref:Uncharacterized protein n=1 Tax=Methyloceanibacter methanicus TaxID=1774968 RepID=A0A1E3VX08_9HYPH|nr:AlpA family phage regulatory protein [Methyloceanibacter methanicus]ODR98067.1 hypothetical protein AUC68_11245 [Methyloceanibacter methanicus]